MLVVAGILLESSLLLGQQQTTSQSKVFHDLPVAELKALQDSRKEADDELYKGHSEYGTPEFAEALSNPSLLIAIVKLISVEPQSGSPYLKLGFEVEQRLRGTSDKNSVYADSHWTPQAQYRFRLGGCSTLLDRIKPEPGDNYLIAYDLHTYGDGDHAFVCGALNLGVPGQGDLLDQIQHFLTIESATGGTNFEPFVAALSDPTPWIRDLAAGRLMGSEECQATPACGEALLARARELLRSKIACERLQALKWLGRLSSIRGLGSSALNSTFRELLASAMADPNVSIADRAYSELAIWDFYRTTGPGHCLEIVAPLRETAVWTYDESKDVHWGTPLGVRTACIPPNPNSGN